MSPHEAGARFQDFGAWCGTRGDLARTARALRELAGASSRPRVTVTDQRGREHVSSDLNELDGLDPRKPPRSVVLRFDANHERRLEVCFGEHPSAEDDSGEPEDWPGEEFCPGGKVTCIGFAEADDLTGKAMRILSSGVPSWAHLRLKGPMSPLRLDNLAGLASIGVGMVMGVSLAGLPAGLFFGLLISFGLLMIGIREVAWAFPAFDVHQDRPRWERRRWILLSVALGLIAGAGAVGLLVVLPAVRP